MENIITALQTIKESGSFCAKRMTVADSLHLEIKHFGPLTFPVHARNAKALIKLAKPAKFGWRDKTLLNKAVRNAWEISKSNLKINQVVWNKTLNSVLELLKSDLGLPEHAKLKAHLHNLLVYEPGQFFDYHQDSEKLDGMVATLVVVLPSSHQGGNLVIDNQGVKKQFQSSRFPLDQLTCIAFYADCHHAVKAIKTGYRIALTYNLTLEQDTQKMSTPNQTTRSHDHLIESLRAYFSDEKNETDSLFNPKKSPKQWVYLLDHNYTQKGLSWNHLKNGDALRAEALKVAANTLDLEIYLALADVQETWDCTGDDAYHYRRRKYSYYEEEDDDEEENDENHVELNELIDSNTTLCHWIDKDNQPLNYKACHVSSRHIGWTKASHEFEPFESEYEGFMGNYGNTMDRWYHRAAIILWQKKDHYPVLFEMDPGSMIHELHHLSKKKSQEVSIRQIVNSLLPYWSHYLRRQDEKPLTLTVLKLALSVKDPQLAQAMVTAFTIKILTPESTSLFLSLQEAYGTPWCINILEEWTKPKDRWGNIAKCEKISEIVKNISGLENKHKALTDWLLAYQLHKIKESDALCKKNDRHINRIKDTPVRMKVAMDFITACLMVNHHLIYAELLNHMIAHIELYPTLEFVDVIYYLEAHVKQHELKQWGYQKLVDYIFNDLNKEKDQGLRHRDDWSIKEKLSCECQDCGTLKEFLQSDTAQTLKWPLGKERRAHIHQAIDGLGIPVTHQTEHTGSPHKLILTKTAKLHSEAKRRFDNVGKALSRLVKNIKK